VSRYIRRDERASFWTLIRAGRSVEEASACLGISARSGKALCRDAGGVVPPRAVQKRCHRLTIEEREQILAGMNRGESIRAIARGIGRSPSTVSRELARNLHRHHQRYRGRIGAGYPASPPWRYSPHRAQLRAGRNAARPKPSKLAVSTRLRGEVQARLKLKHSPEQIARRLPQDFPDDPEMWVSHETIYQSLYVQGRGALNRELTTCLRTGRALRKLRRGALRRGDRRIKGMIHISERPAEVADRAVPGHWEGDLITGKENKSAIGTLVERTTGFVMLLHLPTDHGARAVEHAMTDAIIRLPDQLRKTVTWDQGIEMANHRNITIDTGVAIYFCDPASPWQRGTNENTNGLLRQYFPKGTDLSGYHPDYLTYVTHQLNDRPRKRLNWRTPKEALRALLSDPTDPRGVALTT
jgi:transposase, IS30 family